MSHVGHEGSVHRGACVCFGGEGVRGVAHLRLHQNISIYLSPDLRGGSNSRPGLHQQTRTTGAALYSSPGGDASILWRPTVPDRRLGLHAVGRVARDLRSVRHDGQNKRLLH